MIQVDYIIHGDLDEAGTKSSIMLDHPLSLTDIQSGIPFEGTFHFRIKLSGRYYGLNTGYVWVDLVHPAEELPSFTKGKTVIEIQATPLILPNTYTDQKEYIQYFTSIEGKIDSNPDYRQNRYNLSNSNKESSKSSDYNSTNMHKEKLPTSKHHQIKSNQLGIDTVAKSATQIWNTIKDTATSFQQSMTVPMASRLTDISEENLSELETKLSSKFSDSNAEHLKLLSSLWNSIFPGNEFQRQSLKWKEAGFQKQDPILDLRNSGILALQSMLFLSQNYHDKTQGMLLSQKGSLKSTYPFAIVGVNLTLMLCDILQIRDQQ